MPHTSRDEAADARSSTPSPRIGSGAFPREYGDEGPLVVLLHGGPGAPGGLAPVARALAPCCRVLEWAERRAGAAGAPPVSGAGDVADLCALLQARTGGERPALVGHSAGAILALAYAAAYPAIVRSVVLVGCATLDAGARERFQGSVLARLDPHARAALARADADPDPEARWRLRAEALRPAYECDAEPPEIDPAGWVDARGQEQTWADMLRLQAAGEHPAAFGRIVAPVLMLHGADDPHPGELIRRSLAPHLRRLEFVELARCGHEPWRERRARDVFLHRLRSFLGVTVPRGSLSA